METNNDNNNNPEEDVLVNSPTIEENTQISKQVHLIRSGLVLNHNMDEINNQYLPQNSNQSSGSLCNTNEGDLCIEGIHDIAINNTDTKNGNTIQPTQDLVDRSSSHSELQSVKPTIVQEELCEQNSVISELSIDDNDSSSIIEKIRSSVNEEAVTDPNGNHAENEDSVNVIHEADKMEAVTELQAPVQMENNDTEANDMENRADLENMPNKLRKLDDEDSNNFKSGPCKRTGGTIDAGNDGKMVYEGRTSSVEEDFFDADADLGGTDSDEPCECDACILDVEPDTMVRIKKKPPLRTSSWKKLRNIVHWTPFIQQFKRRKYPWIQLAGHQGNFQAGEPGAILKKYDKREFAAFKKLMKDVLRPYVPDYRGETAKDGERYVQLQDLLCEFEAPCVMDMKMGCRTYLEEELVKAREKPTLRKDMYQKMVEVDPNAPTEEENNQKAITKPRYMQWRDDMSSSTEMGFRIEGIRKSDGAQVKNFKKTKDKNSVKECLKLFVEENPLVVSTYLRRLKAIRATQEVSPFFKSHEIIGSSLLFVHDRGGQASIWMIDFGKTVPLPENVSTTHRDRWSEGNHEDGYLYGMDSLIEIFDELNTEYCCNSSETDTSETNRCTTTTTTVTSDTEACSDTHPQCQTDTSEVVVSDVHSVGQTEQTSEMRKDDGGSSTV